MCTETFLRLPEEKRRRFLDAAWEEFSRARFTDVSINQIVRRAGIPRGSFYQYFSDKEALFAYLLEEVRNHVKEEYRRVLTANGGDMFQAQLDCFDRMTAPEPALDPMMERCMSFVRNNQGVDLQKFLPTRPGQRLLDGLWDVMDLSALRAPTQRLYGRHAHPRGAGPPPGGIGRQAGDRPAGQSAKSGGPLKFFLTFPLVEGVKQRGNRPRGSGNHRRPIEIDTRYRRRTT